MSFSGKALGALGEEIAASHLIKKGYQITDRNFRSRYGEIDIVCRDKKTYIFIEVKSRIGDQKGKPYEAVNYHKLKHIKRAINYYLIYKGINNLPLRFDIVSVEFGLDRSLKKIDHFTNVDLG